jgi:hypothetical protein
MFIHGGLMFGLNLRKEANKKIKKYQERNNENI